MDINFLDSEEVEATTVSYDNHEETTFANNESQETSYGKVSRGLLVVGVFLLPLFFLPWSSSILELNKQLLLLVLAGGALILWLLHVVVSGQLLWRSNPLDKGVTTLLVAVVLSTIFSLDRFKSLFGLTGSLSDSLMTIFALSVFYFGVVNLFDDKGVKAHTTLVYSLFFVLLFGVLNMFG